MFSGPGRALSMISLQAFIRSGSQLGGPELRKDPGSQITWGRRLPDDAAVLVAVFDERLHRRAAARAGRRLAGRERPDPRSVGGAPPDLLEARFLAALGQRLGVDLDDVHREVHHLSLI